MPINDVTLVSPDEFSFEEEKIYSRRDFPAPTFSIVIKIRQSDELF